MKKLLLTIIAVCLCGSVAEAKNLRFELWLTNARYFQGGKPAAIAEFAKRNGFSTLHVRTHRSYAKPGHLATKIAYDTYCSEKLFKALLRECRKRGIRLNAWLFVYGGPAFKIDRKMAFQAADSGCYELIINAEGKHTDQTRYDDAEVLAKQINQHVKARRAKGKTVCKVVSLSTFGRCDRGLGEDFPYVAFCRWFDLLRLQSYWADFDWTPDGTIRKEDARYRNKCRGWIALSKKDHRFRKRIPWVHTGLVYSGAGGTERITPQEFIKFVEACRNAGHEVIDLYGGNIINPELLPIIRKYSKMPVVNKDPYQGLLKPVSQITAAQLKMEPIPPDPRVHKAQAKKPQASRPIIAEKPRPAVKKPVAQSPQSEPATDTTSVDKVATKPLGFLEIWKALLCFHIPWWEAWTRNYWFVFVCVLAAFFGCAATVPNKTDEQRQQVAGAGVIVAFLWKWLLVPIVGIMTWCVTIGLIGLCIWFMIFLFKGEKPASKS